MVPEFSFAPGTIVADDRGYTDYELWGRWTGQGVYFVSRIKRNAVFEAVGERPVPSNGREHESGIQSIIKTCLFSRDLKSLKK